MLFAIAGFAVHLHPGDHGAYHDEGVHTANPQTWEKQPCPVYNVYAGPMLGGAAAHTPWLLVGQGGSFRAVNAAFTRPCLEDDCGVTDCGLKADLAAEMKATNAWMNEKPAEKGPAAPPQKPEARAPAPQEATATFGTPAARPPSKRPGR